MEELFSPIRYRDGGEVECIETIFGSGWGEAHCAASVTKYLRRYKHKGGVADLNKAIQYINFLKAYTEGGMAGLRNYLEELAMIREDEDYLFDYSSMSILGSVADEIEYHTGGRDVANECCSPKDMPTPYPAIRITPMEELMADPNWPYNCTGIGLRKPEGGI